MEPKGSTSRGETLERVIADYEALMQRVTGMHAPEFLEVGITMSQAKTLYLIAASGELHMSELVARLGVSLSTVSGLVERLVDAGWAVRRDDPADRRQVMVAITPAGAAFLERFRELGSHQLRRMLGRLDEATLATVGQALAALHRAADEIAAEERSAFAAETAGTASRKDRP
jgi:DNA-binding MarR family transcriptional regulator